MKHEPRKFTAEEYDQLMRKNGKKVFYSHWDLFDFVYGGKKSAIIKAKYNECYAENSAKEIELEQAKIKQAIAHRVAKGWLELVENKPE